jgi:hypothetical protein
MAAVAARLNADVAKTKNIIATLAALIAAVIAVSVIGIFMK